MRLQKCRKHERYNFKVDYDLENGSYSVKRLDGYLADDQNVQMTFLEYVFVEREESRKISQTV